MEPLPQWTNNRLVVGLILTFISIVIATFKGVLKWYVPPISGFLFALLIISILNRQIYFWKMTTTIGECLSGWGEKILKWVSLIIVGLSCFYGATLGIMAAVNFLVGKPNTAELIAEIAPLLLPPVFFVILSYLKIARRELLFSIGSQFCVLSLFLNLTLSIFYIVVVLSRQTMPVNLIFIPMTVLNIILLYITYLLERKFYILWSYKPPGLPASILHVSLIWLFGVPSILIGIIIQYFTIKMFMDLFINNKFMGY